MVYKDRKIIDGLFRVNILNAILLIIFISVSVALLYPLQKEMISNVTVTVVDGNNVPQSGYSVGFTPLENDRTTSLVAYYTGANGQYHEKLRYGKWKLDVSCSDFYRSCDDNKKEVNIINIEQPVTDLIIKVDS